MVEAMPTATQTGSSATPNSTNIDPSQSRQSSSRKDICFAMRPEASGFAKQSSWNSPLVLKSNNYKLVMRGNDFKVRKYSMHFTPEIPDNSKMINQVTRTFRLQIKEAFGTYCLHGNVLYSTKMHQDPVTASGEHDGQNYELELKYAKCVNDDPLEWSAFQSIIFKAIMGRMSFERDGRNMFNPSKAVDIQQLKVWPGFFSSMQRLSSGSFIQIDLANKVIRTDTLYQILQDLQNKGKSPEQINDELQNTSVVTTYGTKKHSYKIEKIDFGKSPTCTFMKGKEGEQVETSFMDYYKNTYAVTIKDPNQPLVISKNRKTGQEVALIPELCQMTGLTD